MDGDDLEEERAEFDVWGEEMGTETPFAMFFAKRLCKGLNVGLLKARGRPQNGQKVVELAAPIYYVNSADSLNSVIRGSDQRLYEDIEVKRESIVSFVEAMKKEQREVQAGLSNEQDAKLY